MFLSLRYLKQSLDNLKPIHPFYGTTFLSCKLAELPIGNSVLLPIARKENELLQKYYNPLESSDYYFRPFIAAAKDQYWVSKAKYASSGLQTTRTQGAFAQAFIHETKSNWGWVSDYVSILKSNLSANKPPYRNEPVPAFDLAMWLYRERDWQSGTTPADVVEAFINDFLITPNEKRELFDLSVPKDIGLSLFQEEKITWRELRTITGSPADAPPEEGGTLAYLELQEVGPAKRLVFEPAERLSLITGDNGLGKTFLLECAWWALTGQWANPNLPAYPRQDIEEESEPQIIFQIAGESGSDEKTTIRYDWESPAIDKWPTPEQRPTIPGLLIYARVDGSFAICDPVGKTRALGTQKVAMPRSFVFTREQVWDGYDELVGGQKRSRINGLLRDWVSWQNDPDQSTFNIFKKVLNRLSPPAAGDLGPLKVGTPIRMPDDSRPIPTIIHPYGTVPIIHTAAGVRRIVTMAYLLVWAWKEHQINSKEARKLPQKRMVVLIDELEAHLHPQWQRRILPALLEVKEDLAAESELQVQSIIATHSPLVMASVEPQFSPDSDKLLHLDLIETDLFGIEVEIEELPFIHQGLVDFWLTSDVFELKQARSLEGEKAVEEAKVLQQQESPSTEDVRRVSEALQKYLSDIDVFWPRWTFFAEKHGVEL
jgi:hypothetical protein